METNLSLFIESWDFFKDAALAGGILGCLMGVLGTFILLKRLGFLSAAFSQISGGAIAFGFLCQQLYLPLDEPKPWWEFCLQPSFCSGFFCFLIVLLVSKLQFHHKNCNTALVTFLYVLGSTAMLLIGTKLTSEIQDIQHILLGNAVLLASEDLSVITAAAVTILMIVFWFRRGFEISSFHAEGARVASMPVNALQFLLLLLIAISISLTTRTLGALPALAFSVLPAMSARFFCKTVLSLMFTAGILGGMAGFLGYVVAFLYEFPVGPSQALLCLFFVLASGFFKGMYHLAKLLLYKYKKAPLRKG